MEGITITAGMSGKPFIKGNQIFFYTLAKFETEGSESTQTLESYSTNLQFNLTEIKQHSLDILIAPGLLSKLTHIIQAKAADLLNVNEIFDFSELKMDSMTPLFRTNDDLSLFRYRANEAYV